MDRLSILKKFHIARAAGARKSVSRGFTLIELLVVIAIMLVITVITLSSQSDFNNKLLLTDTAYSVALSIRETESLGISSQKFTTAQNAIVQNAGFGIHFESDTPKSYIQFADVANNLLSETYQWCPVGTANMPDAKPGDCLYDGASEQVQKYSFSQGFTITQFCAYSGSTASTLLGCSTGSNPISALDIVYQRPNTKAVMTAVFSSGSTLQAATACVQITSPSLGSDYVEVTQLGEVEVVPSCP